MTKPPFDFAVENYPLAPATFYKVGGPASLALLPRNPQEAADAYAWLCAQPGPRLILGGASNVLVPDEGFPGTVLFTNGLDELEDIGQNRYAVQGGVELSNVVRDIMIPNNFAGTGSLTGIPGTVGGALFMNAGTANGSVCDLLQSVDLLTPDGPVSVTMDPSLYGYRGQTFCSLHSLILQAIFAFQRADEDQSAVYEHYLQRRKEKQPQGDCCGSVFKNPPNDHAGHLIEACGLKGIRQGGAIISPQHANFIVNENQATFQDILDLIELCKTRVRETFGIDLQEEVRIIRRQA